MASESVSLNTTLNIKNGKSTMKRHGYFGAEQIANTLQGSIWSSTHPESKQQIVIKTTNKKLHSESIIMLKNKRLHVDENIIKESAFLKYLTTKNTAPQSIVKYIDFFQDKDNYYLVMEHGGGKLFDFVVASHDRLKHNNVFIAEWHDVCRLLFKQMINAVEYIHSHSVAHFDISLENMLINDIYIGIDPQRKRQFIFIKDDPVHPIQIKLCDFGLSEWFETDDKSSKYCGKTIYKSPEIIARKEGFSAYANDVWCLGVTLFLMILGGTPWKRAQLDDDNFKLIMNGNIKDIAKKWGRSGYVTEEIIDLLSRIFKYEEQRISVTGLKQHQWLS